MEFSLTTGLNEIIFVPVSDAPRTDTTLDIQNLDKYHLSYEPIQ